MKRAILMLAAVALLGATGCGTGCNRDSLTVDWSFFDGANTLQTCQNSGTDTMQVLVNGVAVVDDLGNTRFTCADFPNSITLFGVPFGVNDVEFDAFDVNNQFIAQQHQTVDINRCGDTVTTMSLAMIQAPLVIDYTFPPGACLTTDVIWYRLQLPNGTIFQVDDGNNSGFVVTCGSQINFSPADFGNYQLRGIEIVDVSNPSVPREIASNCVPQAVTHLGFDSIPVALGGFTPCF